MTDTARDRRRITSWQYRTLSMLLYFTLTCWLYGVDFFNNTKIIGGAGADMVQEVWFLGWPAYAVTHGHSLFFTDWINNPHGVNLMANTSMPLLGVLGMPITWIFGPVVTYTIFMRLGFILSAAAMQFVARRVGLSRPAALAAGLIYGFSTIQLVQGNGHLFLVFAPFPPLILYAVYCLLIGRWRPVFAGCIAGGMLALDFLISAERALMTLLALGVVLVVAAAFRFRKITRQLLLDVLIGAACAGGVALVILVIPLYEMTGRGHVSGVAHPWIQSYATDLIDFVFPGRFTWLDVFNMKGHVLAASSQWENGSYVGIPLLVALVVATWRGWKSNLVRIGAVSTVILMGMSLGEDLRINGVIHTSFKSPYKFLTHVKYIQNIEPIRLMYLAWIGVALLAGLALDLLLRWSRRSSTRVPSLAVRGGLAGVAIVVVILSLLPDHPYPMPSTGVSPWLTSTAMTTVIPENSVVLFYPYPTLQVNHAMLDQAVGGYHYKIIGGEALAGNRAGVNVGIQPLLPLALPSVFIRTFQENPTGSVSPLPMVLPPIPPLNATTIAQFHQFVLRNAVRTIVMEDPSSPQAQEALPYLTASFGQPTPEDGGGLYVWTQVQLDHAIGVVRAR